MKIKVGKKYKARNGEIITIAKSIEHGRFVYSGRGENGVIIYFAKDGRTDLDGGAWPYDLIEELLSPFDVKLDTEEQELSDSIERGEWVSIDKRLEKYERFVEKIQEYLLELKSLDAEELACPLMRADIQADILLNKIDNFESELMQVEDETK